MSDFLDRAIALTRQKREVNLISVEVEELGVIYFKPMASMSIENFDKVIIAESATTKVDGYLDVLIIRCLDSEGIPLFKTMDKIRMKKELSPFVVNDIFIKMSLADVENQTVEEIEKNL